MLKKGLSAVAASLVLFGGFTGESHADTVPGMHVKKHLRVDGSSDLRGVVRARSGLHVTAGLTTDTIGTTGPVQIGGILTVAGVATVAGLNAGSGTIATAGTIQAGTVSTSGDITGGSLTVNRTITAPSANIGSGGLQVSGGLTGSAANFSGAVSAASVNTGGAVTAGNATFSRLTVLSGGSINFNNASITGVSGLSLTGNATLSSLQITTPGAGGTSGSQALTITQNGLSSSLSVASGGVLTVLGSGGVAASALNITNDATVGGTLNVSKIASSSQIALNAPRVVTSNTLEVSSTGNLQLDAGGSGAASHLVGNHDTRGQCTTTVGSGGGTQTCGITFQDGYGSVPIVVVSPAGSDPTVVTGFTVQSSGTGFVISFTTSRAATVTFNYMVQG